MKIPRGWVHLIEDGKSSSLIFNASDARRLFSGYRTLQVLVRENKQSVKLMRLREHLPRRISKWYAIRGKSHNSIRFTTYQKYMQLEEGHYPWYLDEEGNIIVVFATCLEKL